MSDRRARALERAHLGGGGLEVEVRLRVERLRSGAVTWDEVAFDAHLGDPAAQLAPGEPLEPVHPE